MSRVGRLDQFGGEHGGGDGAPAGGRADPVAAADDDQRGHGDLGHPWPKVVVGRELGEEVRGDVGVHAGERDQPAGNVLMPRRCVVREHEPRERFACLWGEVTSEESRCDRGGLAARALAHAGWRMGIRQRREGWWGVAKDQPGRQCRVSQREMQGDETAGRVAENDRPLDVQRVAERGDIISHSLKRTQLRGRGAGPALAAQVDKHHLGVGGQRDQPGPQVAMVEPGAARQHDERRAGPQLLAVDREPGKAAKHAPAIAHPLAVARVQCSRCHARARSLYSSFSPPPRRRTASPAVYVTNAFGFSDPARVTGFAAGATGNTAPLTNLVGDGTGLHGSIGAARDPQGLVWVANSLDPASLTAYPAGATGNATPVATIAGADTGLSGPEGIAFDAAGRLFALNNGALSITEYAAGARGGATPIASIKGSGTGLNDPVGLALDPDGNLWVSNVGDNSVIEFAPGANGNANPIARLEPLPSTDTH